MLGVLAGAILLFFLLAKATVAEAPTISNEERIIDESGQYAIQDGAIKPLPAAFASGNSLDSLATILDTSATKRISQPIGQPSNVAQYSGRNYSREEVIQLIKDYSAQYGISSELPLAIAKCESGFSQFSKNRTSTASGVFQYLSGTWKNTLAGRQGVSVFDADANIRMAVSSIAIHGTAPWLASKKCWSK